ncbi:TonB-linked outer membrane protein, SusC/RagA family [Cnuella takakiae]|uniref:TonB-linked outer membrane protein, SusC/RagA family n=1 Tax=Cnuella takakiae TaxID=1302690 RepID=A0A1M5CCF6_9BACT|nr:TonB-dependent receptor [Cnuella takakiae]OLY91762.1 SusC/RagA family TonB-linked outer membrane protein [Cnuella takakiae]SHF52433.1 TonB-linked outer membrane protein, SusC/RagA family [Cnuella takakiae]
MIRTGCKRAFITALCVCCLLAAQAQERVVSGVIADESGAPLSNATVTVKGTNTRVTTDAKGAFRVTVPASAKALTVSYVGMAPQDISVDGRTTVAVNLKPVAGNMNEVVVVGYGRARRANLTSAQTTVSAKDIEKTVNTTIEQALQGRAAGVYVTQNSGQPGGGISVNIRGISSLGRTQPLYVIDGVQIQSNEDVSFGASSSSNPLAGINPNDIEDLQILQGPSATAIYGSRGTNGVILITTKRGRAGDFKINYAYQYNLQTPPKELDVMNLRQYAQMVKEYHDIAGGTTPAELLDPTLLGEGTNWQKELFNNAAMQKHQLSLSGGSNNTTYYMSGEYLNQEGVAVGSGFKRYGFRVNLDNKPREWMTIGANLAFNQTNENLTATNYGDAQSPLIANALRLTPQIPVKNLNGSWGGSDPVNGANQFAPVNPVALANLITNKNMRRQFLGGLNLGINLAKGLVFRTAFNGNVGNGTSTYYTPTYSIDQWHYNTLASLQSGTSTSWYWNWNQMLEYTRKFGKHDLGVMVTHEAQESEFQALTAGRTGFLTNDILDVNAGNPTSATNGGGTYPWSMESYLGRVNYNYDNRYILTGTFRRDGSPNFGSENRWGNFPSVSAAWRVSQEEFFDVPFISELKLRYETGLTGNQGTGSGIYAPLNTGATPWGTGFLPSTFTNPKLQWEETKTNNIGLNLGMWNNRVNIEADYYVKNTDNLILQASLPWYMGTNGSPGSVGAPLVNTGSLQTKGWNFTINTTNITSKNFRWETNLNLSHFKSIVTGLNTDNAFIDRTSWWMNNWTQRAATGQQPWLFRGYVEEGIFSSLDEIAKSAVPVDNSGNRRPVDPSTGIWVGDVKYKDIDGDGKITVADMTTIGNPWPKLTGGLTNTLSYNGFDLSILVTGNYGNDIYNYIAAEASNPNNINLSRNLLINATTYARVATDANGQVGLENPGTRVPRMSSNQVANDNNYGRITTRFVEDGSYLRLKNVSLSYNLPANILSRSKVIKGLKATVGAQNLLTRTKYSGYDPEVGAYVGQGSSSQNQAIGIDFGRYPLTRMYTATVSLNF